MDFYYTLGQKQFLNGCGNKRVIFLFHFIFAAVLCSHCLRLDICFFQCPYLKHPKHMPVGWGVLCFRRKSTCGKRRKGWAAPLDMGVCVAGWVAEPAAVAGAWLLLPTPWYGCDLYLTRYCLTLLRARLSALRIFFSSSKFSAISLALYVSMSR